MKNLFTRFEDAMKPSPPSSTKEGVPIPFGLTASEWTELKDLTSSRGWTSYLKVLDALVRLDGERILQSSKTDVLHFLRGHVAGLRKAVSIIQQEVLKEEHAKRSIERSNVRPERPRSSLFASPGWRTKSKSDAE